MRNTKLVKFSPEDDETEVLIDDVLNGGKLSDDSQLVVSQDGKIYTFRYYNFIKAFNPDLTCRFESAQSKKDGIEKIKENEKKKSAEE